MILICGIDIDANSLPLAEELEYRVNADANLATISLKTQARTDSCVKVYLKDGISVADSVIKPIEHKLVYFKSESDLRKLLEGSADEVESEEASGKEGVTESSEEVAPQKIIDLTQSKSSAEEPKIVSVSSDTVVGEIKEVNMDLPEIFMHIPVEGDDEDSLKQALRSKDKIIEQLSMQVKEAYESVYNECNEQIENIKSTYNAKLGEATVAVNTLKAQLDNEINKGYGRYRVYGQYSHAYLQEGLSDEEKSCLPSNYNNIEVIACGGGQSVYRMFQMIEKNMKESETPFVFIDLTGDYYSSTHFKCGDVALLLKNELTEETKKEFTEGCRKQGNSVIASCNPYHDILLLGINWGTVIKNINKLFGDKIRVFVLLNSIQSFAVEYTLAKLSTILKSFVFVKSSPLLINYLFGKMTTIPISRGIKWLASDSFESVESLLKKVGSKYAVIANRELFDLSSEEIFGVNK